jgi:hypothetical protein
MRHRIHWHVLLTHFPISFFGSAFLFQMLHLFWFPVCFEIATNVALVAGTTMMIPTTWTGWQTWKSDYHGARVALFQRKIAIAFALLLVSIALTVWRVGYLGMFLEIPYGPTHLLYLAGNTLLIVGAAAEGLYGGLLNHH